MDGKTHAVYKWTRHQLVTFSIGQYPSFLQHYVITGSCLHYNLINTKKT